MKKSLFSLAIILLFSNLAHAAPPTPTFPFTVDQFKEKFNQAARAAETDPIKSAKIGKNRVILAFDDTHFQKRVQAMKDLNLANGRFALKAHIELALVNGKDIGAIDVIGDRSDILNLTEVLNTMGALIKALNPSLDEKSLNSLVDGLGLMRGDSDPTIDEPTMTLDRGGAYYCNNQTSSVSTKFGCVVTPRS